MSETVEKDQRLDVLILERLDELISATHNLKQRSTLSIDQVLWSTADVANYIGITYKYANEYIVTHHTFPGAIRITNKKANKGTPDGTLAKSLNGYQAIREAKNKLSFQKERYNSREITMV